VAFAWWVRSEQCQLEVKTTASITEVKRGKRHQGHTEQ
jgi:hypothetical protein